MLVCQRAVSSCTASSVLTTCAVPPPKLASRILVSILNSDVQNCCWCGCSGRDASKSGRNAAPDSHEPTHVLITADSQAAVDAAVALVEPLLNAENPEHAARKNAQLQQLAVLNGTVRQNAGVAADFAALQDDPARAMKLPGERGDKDCDGEGGYRLPSAQQRAAEAQYARDVARVHGADPGPGAGGPSCCVILQEQCARGKQVVFASTRCKMCLCVSQVLRTLSVGRFTCTCTVTQPMFYPWCCRRAAR